MQLPGKMGQLDFSNWMMGLWAAFIGGGAGAFSAGLATIVVDPHDFSIYSAKFWKVVSGTFVISGLGPFFAYLHSKPLPDVITTTTTTTLMTAPSTTQVTVQTHVEEKESKE